ncbi:MAG TPA: tetratricopeptide repeat protein [Polyangiaceae bacterium]|nr:tetratricopeptide repeat protein [Polyangiaceae bacterium]
MIDDPLSELSKTALRDYAGDPRLDRVWQRLSSEAGREKRRSRAPLFFVPALGAVTFAVGIWVGRQTVVTPVPEPAFLAEQPVAMSPAGGVRMPVEAPKSTPAVPPSAGVRRPVAGRSPSHSAYNRPLEPAMAGDPGYAGPASSSAGAGAQQKNWQQKAWQLKADAGDFAGARTELERAGGWDAALFSASPDQLMTLVDVARASGERDQAIRALRRLLSSFPSVPEAPLAAWTLGNLLEQAGDRAGAAEAFAQYRRLSPAGDFAEDAAARQIDAALSEGKLVFAAELVDQYEKDFPHARRLHELRLELRKLQGEQAAPNGSPGGAAPGANNGSSSESRGEAAADSQAEPRSPSAEQSP